MEGWNSTIIVRFSSSCLIVLSCRSYPSLTWSYRSHRRTPSSEQLSQSLRHRDRRHPHSNTLSTALLCSTWCQPRPSTNPKAGVIPNRRSLTSARAAMPPRPRPWPQMESRMLADEACTRQPRPSGTRRRTGCGVSNMTAAKARAWISSSVSYGSGYKLISSQFTLLTKPPSFETSVPYSFCRPQAPS